MFRIFLFFSLILFSVSFSQEKELLYDNQEFNKNILFIGIPTLILSFSLDREVNDFVQSNKSTVQDRFWKNITYLGSPYMLGVGVFGMSISYIIENKKLMKSFLLATQSSVISTMIVLPLKYITNRERPNREDRYSFPSAHSAIAFSFWGSFADVYSGGVIKYIFYTVPVLVAYSRLYLEKHWLSDVIGGAVIGLSSIYLSKKLTNFLSLRFRIGIFIDISYKGFGATYYF